MAGKEIQLTLGTMANGAAESEFQEFMGKMRELGDQPDFEGKKFKFTLNFEATPSGDGFLKFNASTKTTIPTVKHGGIGFINDTVTTGFAMRAFHTDDPRQEELSLESAVEGLKDLVSESGAKISAHVGGRVFDINTGKSAQ